MPAVIFNIGFTTYGAPKGASESVRREHAERRAYYNWTAKYNYKAYMEDKKKTEVHKDYADYMKKGDVLFNQNGLLSEDKLKEIKERLNSTRSIIWHGFISFDEAHKEQFSNKEQCIDYLHDTFNVLIDKSHLKRENVELVASLHTDTEHHHHIHFTFFEREPEKNGQYSRKGTFSQRAIDNFLVSSDLYLDERREQLHIARDSLIKRLRAAYPTARTVNTRENDRAVEKAASALAAKLPITGRLGYNSENIKPLRGEVDKLVNIMIAGDSKLSEAYKKWKSEVAHREGVMKKVMLGGSTAYVDGKKLKVEDAIVPTKRSALSGISVIDDIKKDMRGRLGNYAIKFALSIKRRQAYSGKPTRADKAVARQARASFARGLNEVVRGMLGTVASHKMDYSYDLHRAENEVKEVRSNGKK